MRKNIQGGPQKGLTAIELLVTIAILAILVGIAAPSMTQFIAKWRVSNAINSFTGSLRLARTEAIARSRQVVVCRVDAATSTTCRSTAGTHGYASGWIVFVDQNGNGTYSAAAGDELLLRQEALPGIADITVTGSNAPSFLFDPSGLGDKPRGVNFDASGFDRTSTTPWARRAICFTKPGRIRYVSDSADCTTDERP